MSNARLSSLLFSTVRHPAEPVQLFSDALVVEHMTSFRTAFLKAKMLLYPEPVSELARRGKFASARPNVFSLLSFRSSSHDRSPLRSTSRSFGIFVAFADSGRFLQCQGRNTRIDSSSAGEWPSSKSNLLRPIPEDVQPRTDGGTQCALPVFIDSGETSRTPPPSMSNLRPGRPPYLDLPRRRQRREPDRTLSRGRAVRGVSGLIVSSSLSQTSQNRHVSRETPLSRGFRQPLSCRRSSPFADASSPD